MKPGTLKAKTRKTALHILVAIAFLFGESGCTRAQVGKANTENKQEQATQSEKEFILPDIPQLLTSPEDRTVYLALHYWEHFDFADTTLVSKPEITEQALANFLDILSHVSPDDSRKALTNLMKSASSDSLMFTHFMKLTEKYLYDPNSPLRNEELYIPVLDCIISTPRLDETLRSRSRHLLKRIMKNRKGHVATDFSYTLPNGTVARLSSLKADYTLLFFNNPDCPDCKRVKDYITHSPLFDRLTKTDSIPFLRILAIYPDDDIDLWKRSDYPGIMINGYDAGQVITNQELYDLKAMPTLYLLDGVKRVVLKDATVEQIEAWLQVLLNN